MILPQEQSLCTRNPRSCSILLPMKLSRYSIPSKDEHAFRCLSCIAGDYVEWDQPTLLYGYGGFNVSMMPSFTISRVAWLELEACSHLRTCAVEANMVSSGTRRNGAEKAECVRRFHQGAEYLIAQGYTSPSRLAIMGGSNGGLLVGAAMTQRPTCLRRPAPGGVMDMLSSTSSPSVAWVRDYGSSDDSTNFRNLYAYSPLHNIHGGVAYRPRS